MQDTIQLFVQEMLAKAELNKLPEDFKKDYVEKLTAEVQQSLGVMAIAELDEQGVKDFEKLMGITPVPNPEKVLEFFGARIPDFPKKVSEVLAKFSADFVQGAARLRSQN